MKFIEAIIAAASKKTNTALSQLHKPWVCITAIVSAMKYRGSLNVPVTYTCPHIRMLNYCVNTGPYKSDACPKHYTWYMRLILVPSITRGTKLKSKSCCIMPYTYRTLSCSYSNFKEIL